MAGPRSNTETSATHPAEVAICGLDRDFKLRRYEHASSGYLQSIHNPMYGSRPGSDRHRPRVKVFLVDAQDEGTVGENTGVLIRDALLAETQNKMNSVWSKEEETVMRYLVRMIGTLRTTVWLTNWKESEE